MIQSGAARITSQLHTPAVPTNLAPYIDHTLLKPEVSLEDLKKICQEAKQFNFKSVCVNPDNVAFCARELKDTSVGVTAVIGFPLGATTSRVKAFETDEALNKGASEIDMVINVGALKDKDYAAVLEDIQQVVRAAHGKIVKVILETGLLNETQKIVGCALAKAAGAHFVKTSTGFGKGGATLDDIQLMRQVVGGEMGVKASGGIRDTETALKMISAGATRIGASASVAIVKGESAPGTGY
ncbi:deoxyribose-phosphate aldolase [candidate division CSSED10-310 bacterium]|uniref:Deoxyribose-phosphate aldolase n=1 Tax=candidate division CSSED10-310 bacterium TaxID=2855610 RepID=A0ABV6YVZ0_UNCC1